MKEAKQLSSDSLCHVYSDLGLVRRVRINSVSDKIIDSIIMNQINSKKVRRKDFLKN